MCEGFLQRYVIEHALKKPAPLWISMGASNLDAKAVLVGFKGPLAIEYRIEAVSLHGYTASYLERGHERCECVIPFRLSNGMNLTIRYWYRGVELKFHNVYTYVWGMVTCEAWRREIRNKFQQVYYNRSLKIRDDRAEILQIIVDEHLRRRSRENAPLFEEIRIDRMEVAQLVYGERIWSHPRHSEILVRLDLIIDSLVDDGDLSAEHSRLLVKGRSIASISSRIEDDRRHKDQVAYNKSIKWLTFGLFIAAVAQVFVAFFNKPPS